MEDSKVLSYSEIEALSREYRAVAFAGKEPAAFYGLMAMVVMRTRHVLGAHVAGVTLGSAQVQEAAVVGAMGKETSLSFLLGVLAQSTKDRWNDGHPVTKAAIRLAAEAEIVLGKSWSFGEGRVFAHRLSVT